ncbi:stage III sporulation protein AE [Longirhabdus pacifica]|uniref:stage III sporulation protein AE n=1 Tax=Longirhabdus pacifica TaxID=2305227 RepID=UPI0010089A42|nr:stage III sporulation protein AE [Longirhabdus pacifica]
MPKYVTILLIVWIIFGFQITFAHADSPADKWIEIQTEQLQTEEMEQYWNNLMKEYGQFITDSKSPSLIEMITSKETNFSVTTFLQGILKFLFHEVVYNGRLLAMIILITVFSVLLETFQNAFENKTVSKVAYSVTYILLIVIAINSFSITIDYAKSAISSMIHFMLSMLPLLLTLLASMGNLVTVSLLHPLIVLMIHTIGTLIYTVIFPLLFFSAVLSIVSSITENYKVTYLANLLKNISIAILGIVLSVFLGVVSVQGTTSAAVDGVTIRTAKYITGNFVPVVGRMFSEASDTVIGASLLVKNSIGIVGVIIVVFLCAFPAIKIMALALIYNLSAALVQPLGSSPIGDCLRTIGKNMLYVFASVAAVGFMFFLAITILITAGNVSVMMR